MKLWLFALLQSIIAALGLAAFFWADNVVLASGAAIMAALLGIAQPLIAACKGRRLEDYQDRQFLNSMDAVDRQIADLLQDAIAPPVPHRASLVLAAQERFGERCVEVVQLYDQTCEAIAAGTTEAAELARRFEHQVTPWSAGHYLKGLEALQRADPGAALRHFCDAKDEQPSWILPWLGWAMAAYRLADWERLRTEHPHICGVELMPYGVGNESTFVTLTEEERAALTDQFQDVARSLGNYYTVAELSAAKQRSTVSREEYKRVA